MSAWPDDETVLSRFRQWLGQTWAEAEALAGGDDSGDADGAGDSFGESAEVGLFRLAEELTALRHELKLGTKSSRNLEELCRTTVEAMQAAIEQFRLVKARESQAARDSARPLAEALIELDEALRRGRQVIETARRRIAEEAPAELCRQLDEQFRSLWFWRRWRYGRWHRRVLEAVRRQAEEVQRRLFASLVEGYGLIQSRLERATESEQIVRIDCAGKRADPKLMTVLEVVDDPAQPPGLVIEEVRPGYLWKGAVLRFAEVRAVQEQTGAEERPEGPATPGQGD